MGFECRRYRERRGKPCPEAVFEAAIGLVSIRQRRFFGRMGRLADGKRARNGRSGTTQAHLRRRRAAHRDWRQIAISAYLVS